MGFVDKELRDLLVNYLFEVSQTVQESANLLYAKGAVLYQIFARQVLRKIELWCSLI